MRRKMWTGWLLVVAMVLMALAAGCGQQASTPAGTGSQAAGPAAEPIVLGVATGLGSIEGADIVRAQQMAVDEINAAGGVDVGGVKRPMKVVTIDTREHEPGIPTHDALAALEKLITEQKPHVISSGALRSEVLLSAMDLVAKYKIPYITSLAMSPEFEKKLAGDPEKYKYLFRTGLNAPFMVGGLTQVLNHPGQKFGFNKIYFIHQDVLWAAGTVAGLSGWAQQNGWQIVGTDAYPTGASDFSSSLNKAKAGGAQIIVPIFDMPQSGVLMKQARSMQVPALFVGFVSPAAPGNAWQVFEGAIDGLVNFINEPGFVALTPQSEEFNRKFGEKFGEEARLKLSGHGPGPAYDTVYLLKAAIERAGSLDADALVAEIEKTDMQGVVGRIRFNENHQVIYGTDPTEVAVSGAFQWVDGKRVVVFPEAVAEAEIQLPPGLSKN